MSKNVEQTEERLITSKYSAYALHAGLAGLHVLRACVHTSMRPGNHMQAGTQGPVNNVYCLSTARMISERALVLPYPYITSLV